VADAKGTKAKARVRDTRASVGDADRSGTNKMSAQINISESSQSSKVSQPRPWDQLRFQNQCENSDPMTVSLSTNHLMNRMSYGDFETASFVAQEI